MKAFDPAMNVSVGAGSGRSWRMVATLVVVVAGAVASWPAPLTSQDGEDGECCPLLLVPVGARSSSLGGAIAARQGADAIFHNPAGLAGLEGRTFVIHHSDEVSHDTQVDAFSFLFTPLRLTLGISYQLFDKERITTTDPSSPTPTGELILRDHLFLLSAATPLFAGLSAGASYRLFQERIDCDGSCGSLESVATTFGVDAGLRYAPPGHDALELGLAVVNAGPALQEGGVAQARGLPGRIHLGMAYDVLAGIPTDDLLGLRIALETRSLLRDPGTRTYAFGAEVDVQGAVFLRAGYVPGEGLGTGAAVGVELRYDRFDIGVSRSFVNSQLGTDTEPFQVSLGLHF